MVQLSIMNVSSQFKGILYLDFWINIYLIILTNLCIYSIIPWALKSNYLLPAVLNVISHSAHLLLYPLLQSQGRDPG